MKVIDVIALAAQNIGREDLKQALDAETVSAETQQELDSLLRCYNFVENEIALEYFPLVAEETFVCNDGQLRYTLFTHAPVNVRKAADGAGRNLEFRIFPAYLSLPEGAGGVKITYEYAPEKKNFEDDGAFSGKVSERLMSYGVASEFLLTAARYSESDVWQQRYQDALRAAGILRRRLAVRSRRWV